jgi:hypothetical protein
MLSSCHVAQTRGQALLVLRLGTGEGFVQVKYRHFEIVVASRGLVARGRTGVFHAGYRGRQRKRKRKAPGAAAA